MLERDSVGVTEINETYVEEGKIGKGRNLIG